MKMVGGRMRRQCVREQALSVQLDADQGGQEDGYEPQGKTPVHALVLPEMMQGIKYVGESLEQEIHGKGLRFLEIS